MKKTCPEEAAVSRAAFTDIWDESLRAHVAGCTFCKFRVACSPSPKVPKQASSCLIRSSCGGEPDCHCHNHTRILFSRTIGRIEDEKHHGGNLLSDT